MRAPVSRFSCLTELAIRMALKVEMLVADLGARAL